MNANVPGGEMLPPPPQPQKAPTAPVGVSVKVGDLAKSLGNGEAMGKTQEQADRQGAEQQGTATLIDQQQGPQAAEELEHAQQVSPQGPIGALAELAGAKKVPPEVVLPQDNESLTPLAVKAISEGEDASTETTSAQEKPRGVSSSNQPPEQVVPPPAVPPAFEQSNPDNATVSTDAAGDLTPPAPVIGENTPGGSNAEASGGTPPSLPPSPPEGTDTPGNEREPSESPEPGSPPAPPENGTPEVSGEHFPESASTPGNDENRVSQPTPDTPRSEDDIQKEVEQKIAALPTKVQEMLAVDSALKQDYEKIYQQLVSEELQKTIRAMSTNIDGKEDLQLRIDKARSDVELNDDGSQKVAKNKEGKDVPISKDVQLETAKALEERQGRIKEVQEQANRQAVMELLAKHPENQTLQNLLHVEKADPAKIQEAVGQAHVEADARRQLASEELKAEKGRMARIDEMVTKIEKSEKEPGTTALLREELSIIRRGLKAEALQNLTAGTESSDPSAREKAKERIKELIKLSRQKDHPLAKHPLLANIPDTISDQDALAFVRQRAKMDARLSAEELALISKGEFRKELEKIAKNINEAAGINKYMEGSSMLKFTDAQEIFEAMYTKKLAELRETAAAIAIRKFGEDAKSETLNDIAKGDSIKIKEQLEAYREKQREVRSVNDEAVEKAKKQLKQKVRNKAKMLRHSWQDMRAILKDPNASDEAKRKAQQEFWKSVHATAWEATKLGGWYWLFGNVAIMFLIIAGLVKAGAYIYNQEK